MNRDTSEKPLPEKAKIKSARNAVGGEVMLVCMTNTLCS